MAVLVDPKHDFGDDKQDFASFCLVQFSVRTAESNTKFLDCVSYYRAQEFRRWWPVNVAELKEIMNRICRDIDSRLGSITTIAADPRFSLPKKVPTKVSVPTIDQWVDTDPGRIHLISTALLDKDGVLISNREKVMVDWNLCLNEIAITGEEYPSDGIPVAIDGLELLMECLKSAKSFHKADAAEGARIENLCSDLRSLIYANKGFEGKEDKGQNFENWKHEIDQLLARIRANSAFKDV